MDNKIEKNIMDDKVQSIIEKVIQKPLFDESCIFSNAVRFLGNKWTMIVLVALMERTKRYGELKKQIPTISPKMLAQTLKSLEEKGFINRKDYLEIPPKVEYSLSPLGKSLRPALSVLFEWATEHEKELKDL